MRAVAFINSLSDIETQIDSLPSVDEKLAALGRWLSDIHAVKTVVIADFSRNDILCIGEASAPCPDPAAVQAYLRTLPETAGVIASATDGDRLLRPFLNGFRSFVYVPLKEAQGSPDGALVVMGKNPNDYFRVHERELTIVAGKIRDLMLIRRLSGTTVSDHGADPHPEAALRDEAPAPAGGAADANVHLERARYFINMMNYPMFIMNREADILAVNASLLLKFHFSNLKEFAGSSGLFGNLFERSEVLKTLDQEGGVRSRRLVLTDSRGDRVTVNLSAVMMGDVVVGSLFDVSQYVKVTDDLRESLKMQEFLNDKLISAALLLHKTQISAIRSLARLAEFRDHETGDHLQRICEYSRLISQEVFKRQPYDFKIRAEYCDDIFLSSMLHDIGKVGIPDYILLKKGKLDAEEWKIMKSHTVIGWTILNQADCELGEQSFLTLASQIALNHHERWDGSGYPYGLKEDNIPLSARISAVADVYDALTSQRPYKKPWHHDDAIREITQHSGVAFDPVIVDILLSTEKKVLDIHYRFPK